MKTWLTTFALTALTAAALLLPNAPAYASGSKIYVDDDKQQCKTAQFFKIQDAINAAKPGDTVYVCSGSYAENLTISKKLTLRSQVAKGQALPLLANFTSDIATINVFNTKDVIIRDLRLAGKPDNDGVVVGSKHVTVQSLTLSDFSSGITVLNGSDKSVIQNNTLTNTKEGILIEDSRSVKVTSNTVTAPQEVGIRLVGVTKSSVSKNTVTDSKHNGIGVAVADTKDNTLEDNIIKNSANQDAHDTSVGNKTAGTANTWKNNTCVTSDPAGLCKK